VNESPFANAAATAPISTSPPTTNGDQVGFASLLSYESVQEHAEIGGRLFRLPPIQKFAESLMSVLHGNRFPNTDVPCIGK
jgi:hypothetical protein